MHSRFKIYNEDPEFAIKYHGYEIRYTTKKHLNSGKNTSNTIHKIGKNGRIINVFKILQALTNYYLMS